jgi:hypothetical protein
MTFNKEDIALFLNAATEITKIENEYKNSKYAVNHSGIAQVYLDGIHKIIDDIREEQIRNVICNLFENLSKETMRRFNYA